MAIGVLILKPVEIQIQIRESNKANVDCKILCRPISEMNNFRDS